CYGNRLTSLDVSKNTALTYLDCTGPGTGGGRCNELTSLDVSKNTALTDLRCSGNLLTSLDLSNQNHLSSTELSQILTVKAVKLADDRMGIDLGASGIDAARFVNFKKDGVGMDAVVSGQYLIIADNVYDSPGTVKYQYDTQCPTEAKTMAVEITVDLSDFPSSGIFLNEQYFPDAYFRAALADLLGINEGDELSMSHIRTTYLGFGNSKYQIYDPTGIEYFTALRELFFGGCRGNFSLDVSKNLALEELGSVRSDIASINASGLTALKIFEFSDTPLESVNITGCTALEKFMCFPGRLTSLDLSDCTALTYLRCYANDLNSLDVSQNTALTYLECSSNQLTALDVSKNTALTYLNCSGNQLTSLDLPDCTALTELYCQVNQIFGSKMQALVKSLPTVKSGVFFVKAQAPYDDGNVITKSQVKIATDKGWAVKARRSDGTQIDYAGTDVEINVTNFPDANFRTFVSGASIDTDGNDYLSNEEIAAVTNIDVIKKSIADLTGIEHFTALKNLRCTGNQLTSLDVSGNTELTYLECSENQLTELNVSQNKKLTELWCDGNQIKGDKMLALVESLPEVTPSKQFGVINTKNDNEGNVITKSQVKVATDKGWAVKDWNGGSAIDYAGSDIPGDVNGDGVVNASDIMSIYNIMKQ
ncbi:MAG: leucine-rich repeat domain-containing protein, partial [Prevotella sp.]|nr:leucine-rich repeat domain-containing protein [Prevotella sp.]